MTTGWQTSTLGEVLSVLRNGVNCKQDKSGEGEMISRIESISDATFNLEKVGYAKLSHHDKERFRLLRGDILFSHINSAVHVGKTAMFDSDEPVYHGINLLLMRAKESITSAYLDHALKFLFQSGYWLGICKQSVNQASVNQQDISEVEVRYPKSLSEQKRIVGILDEAFESITNARVNAEKNLRNARAVFTSHLHSLYSRRGPGWVESRIDHLSTNLDSKRVPITKNVRTGGGYPYYGASGIVEYVEDFIFEGDSLLVSEDGANLLARSTPIAFPVSGKCWVNNHAHVLKFKEIAAQRYVEFYLGSIPLDEFITGTAQPKLNQKALNSIPIPIPISVEARAAIVEGVELLQEETERLACVYEQKIASLGALKRSLLHHALTGKL